MLLRDEFDCIMLSNRVYQHIFYGIDSHIKDKYFKVLDIIKHKADNGFPITVLDQNDGAAIDYDLIDLINPKFYFKRDYIKDKSYDSRIMPLNFCYSEKYVPNIDVDKTNTLFWLGRAYCGRTKYLNACKNITPESEIVATGKGEIICGQVEYSQRMLKHKIGLNLFGYGYGDMRYFEIPAHGLLLLSQRLPVFVENDYVDMQNAIFFDSMDDMRDKLKYCLAHEDFVDKARFDGHQHMIKYHTTKARAQQLLDKIC